MGLPYAQHLAGADTIFLLSDGSPTTAEGKALPTEEFERQSAAFLEANKIYAVSSIRSASGPGTISG